MVNADVRIDYYEVLGVTTRAENDEVKKQYRALAKRYHPDRNPGKEDEFIGKFQAIQAAYEVLTDPAQRRKYDHDRLRFGYGRPSVSRSSSTTRQTYSQARRSAYAEPSRSHTTVRPTATPKFSTFGKAGPDSFYDERTKAEAYPAFRNMRSPFTTPGFDSRAGRSYQPPRGSRPQSAYEAYFSKPSTDTRKTSKKKGFSPSNLQGDDEPMATSKSAYSTVNNKSTTHSFFEPVTSPTARKAVYEDARASYLNVEKNGSKYASTGGERISLGSTPGIRHTYREPSSRSRTNPPSPTSPPSIHARRRSESLDRPQRATTTASISDDEDEISFAGRNYGKSSTRRNDPFDRFSKPADTGHAPDNSGRPRRSSRVYDPPPTPKPTTPLNESVDAKPSRRPATYNASQNFSAGSFGKPSKSRSHESLNSSLPVDGGVRFGPQTKQEDGSSRGKPSARPRSASNAPVTLDIPFPPPQQTSFAAEKFSDSNWTEKLQSQWTSQNQATGKNFVRSRSPRKQTNRPGLRRMAPKPAQVSTEAEEEKNTVKSAEGKTKSSGTSTDDSQSDSDFSSDSDDPEAMDIDEVPPAKQQTPVSSAMNMASKPASKPTTRLQTAPSSNDSGAAFDLKGFDKAFDTPNKSGVGDLRDIQSALPFESQPEKIEMRRSYEEHVLSLPLPPKKIDPPFLLEESGVFQLNTDLLTKESWILYYRQMQSYHREWKKFDREMLEYIQKRQEMVDKGFVGNWMNSNSKRLNIEGYDKSGTIHNETLGEGRGGFNDYMQELVDAERVQEHWAVALERHRKCIEIFGRARNIAASRLS